MSRFLRSSRFVLMPKWQSGFCHFGRLLAKSHEQLVTLAGLEIILVLLRREVLFRLVSTGHLRNEVSIMGLHQRDVQNESHRHPPGHQTRISCEQGFQRYSVTSGDAEGRLPGGYSMRAPQFGHI